MINCTVYLILVIVIAGVLVWAVNALPLDNTIKQIGRVAIILVFVIMLALEVMSCLGLSPGWPPRLVH